MYAYCQEHKEVVQYITDKMISVWSNNFQEDLILGVNWTGFKKKDRAIARVGLDRQIWSVPSASMHHDWFLAK